MHGGKAVIRNSRNVKPFNMGVQLVNWTGRQSETSHGHDDMVVPNAVHGLSFTRRSPRGIHGERAAKGVLGEHESYQASGTVYWRMT